VIDFATLENNNSRFTASFSGTGGNITFSNSGQRGTKKYFTLGVTSFITCIEDIVENLNFFQGHEIYNETDWRNIGALYFKDLPANAQITVQTKPLFSTLSKIILWANPTLMIEDPENEICLSENELLKAISELKNIETKFVPLVKKNNEALIVSAGLIRDFAKKTFEYFYDGRWADLIDQATLSDRSLEGNKFTALKIGPFTGLLARFDSPQTADGLKSKNTLRYFVEPVFINDKYNYYFSTQWNANGDYPLHFDNLKVFFEREFQGYRLEKTGDHFRLVSTLGAELAASKQTLPKPFVLLAGISGTGKTRFVKKQAQAHGVGNSNCCIVPVRPDWHEPSDLLGYVSRVGEKPEYVSTRVLQFVIDAWRAIAPNADANGTGLLNQLSPPYWLCLDEMNLAPVEQYFADYLSVLESRRFNGNIYTCEPLLDCSVLKTNGADVKADLGMIDDDGLWNFFLENGIPLPPNLIVAGTVNMDETTHGFSRKVIDRAFTLDFGEFFPNDYSKFFSGQDKPKILTYGLTSQVTVDSINCDIDNDGQKTIKFLSEVNNILRSTPFELAYRALNELLLHVSSFAPQNNADLQAVWDDFLMTKVLPRIDGDEDKLRVLDASGSSNLLYKLEALLAEELNEIWPDGKERIDLLAEQECGDQITNVACRSKKKIRWMIDRLEANTFTSYWP
jgi:hypothetical protein